MITGAVWLNRPISNCAMLNHCGMDGAAGWLTTTVLGATGVSIVSPFYKRGPEGSSFVGITAFNSFSELMHWICVGLTRIRALGSCGSRNMSLFESPDTLRILHCRGFASTVKKNLCISMQPWKVAARATAKITAALTFCLFFFVNFIFAPL